MLERQLELLIYFLSQASERIGVRRLMDWLLWDMFMGIPRLVIVLTALVLDRFFSYTSFRYDL